MEVVMTTEEQPVLSETAIESAVGDLIPENKLRRRGQWLIGPCPIHNGDNVSQFQISLASGHWNCTGQCHSSGDLITLLRKCRRVPRAEAARLLEIYAGRS